MKRVRLVLALLACLISTAAPLYAAERSATIHVKLHVVAKPCLVQAPATVTVDRYGQATLSISSVLPDCTLMDTTATLTVKADSADKGTDVATINF